MGAHGIDPVRYLEGIARDTRSTWGRPSARLKLEKRRDGFSARVAFHQRRSEAVELRRTTYQEQLVHALSDGAGHRASLSLIMTTLGSLGLMLTGVFVLFWDAWSGRVLSSHSVFLAAMTACGGLLLGRVQPEEHMSFFSHPRLRTLLQWGLPVIGSALVGILLHRSTVIDPYVATGVALFIALVMLASGPSLRSILLRIGPSLAIAYHGLLHRYHQYRMHRCERDQEVAHQAYAAQEHALEREIDRRQSFFLRAYDFGAHWARCRAALRPAANGHVVPAEPTAH